MRLTGVVDGRCHVSIAKAHAWWRWAVRWAAASNRLSTGVAHIARVDDDTFLHLPNLEADMGRLHCHPRLVYGLIAWVGYNPHTFVKCGYSWRGNGAWSKYRCGSRGAHEASPFPSGMLQILSWEVAIAIAHAPAVQAFVRRATARVNHTLWDKSEDVAMGHWLMQMAISGSPAARDDLMFASLEPTRGHNLGCRKSAHLYRRPRNASVAIHFVKRPEGMGYLYSLLREQRPHAPRACSRAAGVS